MIAQKDIRRFEGKIRKTNNCWLYTAGINTTGRGMFWLNGKSCKAHRIAWLIYNGEISNGLLVCHKCDNGKCVNPKHLFLGTYRDNTQDMIKKGRFVGNTRLSNKNKEKIKLMFLKGISRKDIAKVYKEVKYEHICKIIKD